MRHKPLPIITKIEKRIIHSTNGHLTLEFVSSMEGQKDEVEVFVKSAPYLSGMLRLFDDKAHKKILILCEDLNFGISAAQKATSCMSIAKDWDDFYEMDFDFEDQRNSLLAGQDETTYDDEAQASIFPILWESQYDPSTNYTGETNQGPRELQGMTPIENFHPENLIIVADGLFPITKKTSDLISAFEGKLIVVVPSKASNEITIDNLVFECDFDVVEIGSPSNEYLERLLHETARKMGYSISYSADLKSAVAGLKEYRLNSFCEGDILTYLERAIKSLPDNSTEIKSLPVLLRRKPIILLNPFDEIVGLESIKDKIYSQIHKAAHLENMFLDGYGKYPNYMHMAFEGNPGTCKTTMARAAATLFKNHGLVSNGFYEIGREDIVGRYVGETSLKVKRIFDMAKGGVIFIDEVGSLLTSGSMDSFAEESLNAIVRHMENDPNTVVILATYPNEMRMVLGANPGLRSRINEIISFPDYSPAELVAIFKSIAVSRNYVYEDGIDTLLMKYFKDQKRDESFGNGREARKLFEASVTQLSMEIASSREKTINRLTRSSIERAMESIESGSAGSSTRAIGFQISMEVN